MSRIKSIISRLAKTGLFHVFGGSVINKIVTFLSSVVIVRILTKEEYGVFTYAWNIYNIIIVLNGLGAASAVLQMCSEKSGNELYARQVCNYGTRFGLVFDILIALAFLVIGTFVPLEIEGAGELLRLLCLLPVVRLVFDLMTSYLRAQKRNQDFAVLNTVNTVVVFAGSAVGAFLFREKGMVLGYYLAYALSVILGRFWKRVQLFSKEAALSKEDKRALRSIAIVSMCNTGLSQLMYQLDIFVLGIVDPQETVLATYRVATIIPSALPFIPIALITYIYPYFAEHRNDGAWCLKRYKQIVLGLGAVNFVISGVLYFFAPFIIRVFFGEEYMDALSIFRLLSVNFFVSGTFRILSGNLLVTQRKLKFNFLVAVVSSCVNVAANFLFINWWGAMGAALATVLVVLLTSVANTFYLVYTFKKKC